MHLSHCMHGVTTHKCFIDGLDHCHYVSSSCISKIFLHKLNVTVEELQLEFSKERGINQSLQQVYDNHKPGQRIRSTVSLQFVHIIYLCSMLQISFLNHSLKQGFAIPAFHVHLWLLPSTALPSALYFLKEIEPTYLFCINAHSSLLLTEKSYPSKEVFQV